jgi:hypothetical protein
MSGMETRPLEKETSSNDQKSQPVTQTYHAEDAHPLFTLTAYDRENPNWT